MSPLHLLSEQDLAPLKKANAEFQKSYPGESSARQPVHTLYGGAHLFEPDLKKKMGERALHCLKENAPSPEALARVLGWTFSPEQTRTLYDRIVSKLQSEPVEDVRIDFEDGYGNRPDAEEDAHAESTAKALAKGYAQGILPPFFGIRTKPFNQEAHQRSIRTLEIFVPTLVKESNGQVPKGFVITLPKVTCPEQITAFVQILEALEKHLSLPKRALQFEFMIEVTQALFDQKGRVQLPFFLQACEGRCTGVHFGTYDYTASCGITAAHQEMVHPACDFAKNMMQVCYSGTGVMLSDGATNVMPVGDSKTVHAAWKLAYDHTRHSLRSGFYQGWDLHPNQLPIRYAAVFAFFQEGLAQSSSRLKGFIDKAARATLLGDVFDDAATGQGLLNFFLRGISCGAITEDEARATGLTIEEIRGRSFLKILNQRKMR